LSMGAGQAWQIGTANLDKFAYIGGFSGGASGESQTAYTGVMADAKAFNKQVKVLYISIGTEENVQGLAHPTRSSISTASSTCTSSRRARRTSGRRGGAVCTVSPLLFR
jgi:hypothetical protein